MRKRFIFDTIAFLYLLCYLYPAVTKLRNIPKFRGQINNQPFDDQFTPYMVVALPTVLISISAMLFIAILTGKLRKPAILSATTLMALFTIYVALVYMKTFEHMPCSCAGIIESITWGEQLVLNIVFLFMGSVALWIQKGVNNSPTPTGNQRFSAG